MASATTQIPAMTLTAYSRKFIFFYQPSPESGLLVDDVQRTVSKPIAPGSSAAFGDDVVCTFEANGATVGIASYPPSSGKTLFPTSAIIVPPTQHWIDLAATASLTASTFQPPSVTVPATVLLASSTSQPPSATIPTTTRVPDTTGPTSLQSDSTVSSFQYVTTASSSAQPTKSPTSEGLAGGAVAGVAIGCLVVGAAIAGFVVWILMRRSRKRRQLSIQDGGATAHLGHEKQPILGALSKGSSNSTLRTIENNLPLPLEDNAISGDVTKLSTLIKNHVQSYYHESSVPPDTVTLDAFQALGNNLPISVGTLGTLLANPTTREVGLRFCIAWVIVARINPKGDPTATLLPPEIVHCMLSMTALDGKPQVRDAFLRNWRTITGELMQTSYLRSPFTSQDARNRNIARTTGALEAILSPYAVSQSDHTTRRRNLEEIIKRAATFAFVIFSQPSSWRMEWPDARSMEPGSLVIFPALEQLADEEGRAFSPPRVFSEKVVRRIEG